jgi:hypothetical protein
MAFTPLAPLAGMPASSVDRGAPYAGDTALRINEIISAQQAVNDLAPLSAYFTKASANPSQCFAPTV